MHLLLLGVVFCPKPAGYYDIIMDMYFSSSSSTDYVATRRLGSGFFGETWLAKGVFNESTSYVMKKIKPQIKDHTDFYKTGIRECYFGRKISMIRQDHVARFADCFQQSDGLFIVSYFEGQSLESLMYQNTEGPVQSQWWMSLKTTKNGAKAMQKMIFQMVKAIDFLRKNNITHRDIKPANMVLCSLMTNGSCSMESDMTFDALHLRLIDLGSALDDHSIRTLYGQSGPTTGEQSSSYMPPEAMVNNLWIGGSPSSRHKYDVWTVGQVIMELTLGDPEVFSPVTPHVLHIAMELIKSRPHFTYFYARYYAFVEYCIDLSAFDGWDSSGYTPELMHCKDKDFNLYVKRRDPFRLGFQDMSLLHLARDMLHGDPNKRITAEMALKYKYFQKSLQ